MKFCRLFCLILCMSLMFQAVALPVFADEEQPDSSVISGCRGIDSTVPLLGSEQFTENAQSIFLFEANSDTLMYAWNPDQQIHPAGMVKIMTAFTVLKNGNLSDVVTVEQSVLETLDKADRTSGLQVGEALTVEQLLYCLLVGGSNDASVVLAHHVGGSVDAFVTMMNDLAEELGCTNTFYTNPHGFHDEQQLSSARDIARIIDAAIENEQFRTIFGTTNYTVEKTNKSEARDLESSNHMMHENVYEIYYDERVTGGRTGVSNTGLRYIATTAKQGDLDLICVVLGADSVYNDLGYTVKIGGYKETSALLDSGFTGFKVAQLLYENQALKQCQVRNGSADVVIGPNVSVSCVVPDTATTESFTYRYVDVEGAFTAPVQKGQHMSGVEIWNGNVCIAKVDLFALNDVSVNYQQIIQKEKKGLQGWAIVLIVLLVAIVGCVASVYFIRWYNIRRKRLVRSKKRKRNYRQRREL